VRAAAPDAPLRERLEFDAAAFVKPVGGVDEADHAVLYQVSHINRVGHGRRHSASERLHERQSVHDSTTLGGGHCLGAHFVFGS
jgi:hypothetical protein